MLPVMGIEPNMFESDDQFLNYVVEFVVLEKEVPEFFNFILIIYHIFISCHMRYEFVISKIMS